SEFLTGSQNGVFVPSIVSAAGRALGKLRAYAATTVDSSGQHRNEEILKAVLLSSKEREIWELNCTGIDKREIALRYEMTNDQVRNVINRARMLIARAQGPLSQDEQIVVQAFGEGDNDARLVSKRCELSKNRLATAKRIINARVAVRLGRIPEEETIESPHIIDQIKGSRLRGVAALHFLKLRQVEIANRFDCDVKDIYSRVNALRVRFGIVSAQSERLRELRHKWNTDYQHPPEQAGAELRSIWSSLRPESRMALGLFLTGLTKREAAAKVGITFNEFDYSYRRALSELPTASVRKEIESVRQRVELASDRWNLIFAEPPATAPTQLAAVWSNLSPSHQMALTYRLLGTKSEDAALETGISPSNYRHMLANALKNLPSDVHEQLKATLKLISVRLKSRLDPESIGKGAIESQG
ncbi:MAG: hypothetical protein KDA72_15720, partial [Planctomycetales bacterium]|nr:hypothetical protein [Planctomycetales bacterium]